MCLEYCLTLKIKILRSKGVLRNLQLLRRQLFRSNRTSFSSSVDVDLYGRMGLSSLCSPPNNNCQPDSNIKPYVHCQATAVASATTELLCNMRRMIRVTLQSSYFQPLSPMRPAASSSLTGRSESSCGLDPC